MTKYDYSSIMHYNDDTCAINKNKSMIKVLRPPFKLTSNNELSDLDVEKIQKLYKCNEGKKKM